MPRIIASWVTSISRSARRGISPTGYMRLEFAMPAVEDQGHVDIDDVALLHRLVAGDAVADDVVDRGAGRLAIAAIHQGRRQRAVVHGEVVNELVDLLGRHARQHVPGQHVEAARGQLPALRMPSKAAGPWILICPVLRRGAKVAST